MFPDAREYTVDLDERAGMPIRMGSQSRVGLWFVYVEEASSKEVTCQRIDGELHVRELLSVDAAAFLPGCEALKAEIGRAHV